MFSEEKLSQPRQKKPSKYWYKIFSLKHIIRFGIWNNISKLTKVVKAYVYQMLLNFKMLVTFSTANRASVSVVKLPPSDITQFLAGHCSMPGANIQTCTKEYQWQYYPFSRRVVGSGSLNFSSFFFFFLSLGETDFVFVFNLATLHW